MDNFSEQLVTRNTTTADIVKRVLVMIAAVLLASFFMWLAMNGMFYMVMLAFVALGGGIWLWGSMNVEYEYIVTNDELDIDKIIGRRKRKRMITLDLRSTEDFGTYPPQSDIPVDATVHATTGLEKDAHYLLVNHNSYGKVMLIFNPNEKTREAIMQEVPNTLRVKIKHNAK